MPRTPREPHPLPGTRAAGEHNSGRWWTLGGPAGGAAPSVPQCGRRGWTCKQCANLELLAGRACSADHCVTRRLT